MRLKSSVVKTDVAEYGDLYIETFAYDIEAVVNKDIIPEPSLYDISLDDSKATSDFYWNYAGDYLGFASFLLYENEATFTFNEKSHLLPQITLQVKVKMLITNVMSQVNSEVSKQVHRQRILEYPNHQKTLT